MAAPKTVYSVNDLRVTSGGTSHRLGRMALAKTAYSNENTFKTRFKVDKVIYTKDNSGKDCVIGAIKVGQSDNSGYHASKRFGRGRVTCTDLVIMVENHKDYTIEECESGHIWGTGDPSERYVLVDEEFSFNGSTYSLWQLDGDSTMYAISAPINSQDWDVVSANPGDPYMGVFYATLDNDFQVFYEDDNRAQFGEMGDDSSSVYFINELTGDAGDFQLLTDAGLNTLPISVNSPSLHKVATNRAYFGISVESAYYQPTTVDINIKRNDTGTQELKSVGTVGSGQTVTSEEHFLTNLTLVSGKTYSFMLVGTNEEGPKSGGTSTYTPYGPCKFIVVYAVSDISSNPTGGTPYGIVIFAEDYANKGGGVNKTLYDLFNTTSGTSLATYERFMYTDESAMVIDACTWGNYLPTGKYYGFPTTYDGTDYKIVETSTWNGAFRWYNSTYTPTFSNYYFLVDASVDYSNVPGMSNVMTSYANLQGSRTYFNQTLQTLGSAGGYTSPTYTTAQISNETTLVVDLSNITWNWQICSDIDVTLTVNFGVGDISTTATFNDIDHFPEAMSVQLDNLKTYAEAGLNNNGKITISIVLEMSPH